MEFNSSRNNNRAPLSLSNTSLYDLSRRQLVVAGALGNLAMAVAGLLVFQIFGQAQPAYLWALALVGNPLVGAFGGFFGAVVVERVKGLQTRRVLEAKAAMKVRA